MAPEPPAERWLPHVTVAAVVEDGGRFLCVEERVAEGTVINQPAGHLEEGETLPAAARREVMEETAHRFEPRALVGIYHYRAPANGITYLRFCFAGVATGPVAGAVLDPAILAVRWYSRDDLAARRPRLRSPLVERSVDDYLAGRRLPLDVLRHLA